MPNPWVHKSLDAVLVTGAGSGVCTSGRQNISWQYKLGGTVAATAVSVILQGKASADADYVDIGDSQTDVNGALVVSAFPTALHSVRLYLTTMTGGTAPSVSGWIVMS